MDDQFDAQENTWFAASKPTDYWAKLSEELHGMDGPGLWLDLLPSGSLQSAGQETVGGFTAQKVNGKRIVDDQTITGTLWFDVESHALVQVELHVPAALLSISEEPAQGDMLITLEAQKAEVPDITVPTAPAP